MSLITFRTVLFAMWYRDVVQSVINLLHCNIIVCFIVIYHLMLRKVLVSDFVVLWMSEYVPTNPDGIAYYSSRPYCNITGPPLHLWSIINRNVVMQCMTVFCIWISIISFYFKTDNERIFAQHLQNKILPDHTYAVISGGDPLCIPELTWEQLKQFHATHYHPSNAR